MDQKARHEEGSAIERPKSETIMETYGANLNKAPTLIYEHHFQNRHLWIDCEMFTALLASLLLMMIVIN